MVPMWHGCLESEMPKEQLELIEDDAARGCNRLQQGKKSQLSRKKLRPSGRKLLGRIRLARCTAANGGCCCKFQQLCPGDRVTVCNQ